MNSIYVKFESQYNRLWGFEVHLECIDANDKVVKTYSSTIPSSNEIK